MLSCASLFLEFGARGLFVPDDLIGRSGGDFHLAPVHVFDADRPAQDFADELIAGDRHVPAGIDRDPGLARMPRAEVVAPLDGVAAESQPVDRGGEQDRIVGRTEMVVLDADVAVEGA